MQLIMFSKMLRDRSVPQLAALAHELGLEGWDLCVRPDYPVHPDNAATALPEAVRTFAEAGLSVPMVTGNFDLLEPTHPTAAPILAAMDKADVRRIKLGYYMIDPEADYWAEVDRIRRLFDGWAELSRRYGVQILYHTHSVRCHGLNASMLMHLLKDFDPACLGAYIDPGHLCIEGEEFAVAAAVTRTHLAAIGLKDALLTRGERDGHGTKKHAFVLAGEGMVDWTSVFDVLVREGFDGPLTLHCEFEVPEARFLPAVKQDADFFRAARDRAVAAA